MDRLSQELVDQIIDNLHLNVAALKACSLTCSSWLPSARFHLPPSIKIEYSDQLHSLLKDVDILLSTVKRLEIWASEKCPLDDIVEAPFWNLLDHLDHLCVSLQYTESAHYPLEKFLEKFPSIKRLEIKNSWFNSLQAFLSCVGGFQNLTSLEIFDVSWDPTSTKHSERIPVQFPNLRRLEIQRCNWRQIVEEMLASDSPLRIRNVELELLAGRRAGGDSTQSELYIRFLERCTGLRKMHLGSLSRPAMFLVIVKKNSMELLSTDTG